METATLRNTVLKVINSSEILNTVCNLRSRWNDESKFENFADYELVMKQALAGISNIQFVKGTKRPFGFIIKVTGVEVPDTNITVELKVRRSVANLRAKL